MAWEILEGAAAAAFELKDRFLLLANDCFAIETKMMMNCMLTAKECSNPKQEEIYN